MSYTVEVEVEDDFADCMMEDVTDPDCQQDPLERDDYHGLWMDYCHENREDALDLLAGDQDEPTQQMQEENSFDQTSEVQAVDNQDWYQSEDDYDSYQDMIDDYEDRMYEERYDWYEEDEGDQCIVGMGGGICPCCGGIGDPDGRNARRRMMFSGLRR